MYKFLFILLFSISCFGQKLHHQMITSQGTSVTLSNKFKIAQSVGQTTVIGNYSNKKFIVGQGFIQSTAKVKIQNQEIVENEVSVILYPNPVKDIANFLLSTDITTPIQLYIFDDRGRLVLNIEKTPISKNISVDLSNFANGVYFAKFANSNFTSSIKILKSR